MLQRDSQRLFPTSLYISVSQALVKTQQQHKWNNVGEI